MRPFLLEGFSPQDSFHAPSQGCGAHFELCTPGERPHKAQIDTTLKLTHKGKCGESESRPICHLMMTLCPQPLPCTLSPFLNLFSVGIHKVVHPQTCLHFRSRLLNPTYKSFPALPRTAVHGNSPAL